jgi:hypothetical protein
MHPKSETREIADLATQFESLLDVVWQCEQEWRLDDRIALSLRRDGAVAASQAQGPEGR